MNFALSRVLILAFCLPMTLNATPPSPETDDPARPTIGQSGEIFTLSFAPAKRSFTIGLVGKPLTTLGPAHVIVMGRSLPNSGGTSKSLNIQPVDDHFEIFNAPEPGIPIEIEVKDAHNGKSDKFKVDMKRKP